MLIHGGIFLSMTMISGDVTRDPGHIPYARKQINIRRCLPDMAPMLPDPAILLQLL